MELRAESGCDALSIAFHHGNFAIGTALARAELGRSTSARRILCAVLAGDGQLVREALAEGDEAGGPDGYGITPKGQQDRRWARPLPPRPLTQLERIRAQAATRYDHLRQPSAREVLAVLEAEAPVESARERLERIEGAQLATAKARLRRIAAGIGNAPPDDH